MNYEPLTMNFFVPLQPYERFSASAAAICAALQKIFGAVGGVQHPVGHSQRVFVYVARADAQHPL